MLFSVLISKGQGHQAQLSPSEAQAWLRGRGPLQISPPECWHSPQPGPPTQCPVQLLEEVDLSWQHLQGQVSTLCPAVITEGARAPSSPWALRRPNRGMVL